MSAAVDTPPAGALWPPEYERLAIHCTSCPTCTAVDSEGVNLNLPCNERTRLREEYRQARRRG